MDTPLWSSPVEIDQLIVRSARLVFQDFRLGRASRRVGKQDAFGLVWDDCVSVC